MKVADWVIRAIVLFTFLSLLFAPQRLGFPMMLFAFAAVGIWAIFYPAGVLGWAKTAHPNIDVDDRSIWWVPRFLGGAFLCAAIVLSITFHG